MGSDRARVTYDPTRQYRAIVAQQGRVTLEADQNEAWTIADERERMTLRDLVGSAGTPDNGYEVSDGSQLFDLVVGAGTMYVGGVRVELPDAVTYSNQAEWLDRDGDPDWVGLEPSAQSAFELILLELTEHEVGATEDPVLREVALGGPDTAQRVRLVQRIKRMGTKTGTCDEAMSEANSHWQDGGREFSSKTMLLSSTARLQVGFADQGPPPDDCDPAPVDGYLGAENQLIRVQVTGPGTLLWGYDDASFLYRVDVTNSPLVKLQSRPPDAFHQPRKGQAVELLRSAARLTDSDFVAAGAGQAFALASAYDPDPDSQHVTLPSAPDAAITDPAKTPQVFLRVWEEELTFTAGVPVTLGTTGLTVTLTGKQFHPGDFWQFAVRPSTPQLVYPDRYHASPQPPDGPRTWVCPLAVVWFDDGVLKVVEDCRCRFDDLCELTWRDSGCCDIVVGPAEVEALQDLIDGVSGPTTICLTPGVYELQQPLLIGPASAKLTIEGQNGGAVLRAAPSREDMFLQGLVVVNGASGITLRGLEFDLPQVVLETVQAGQLRSGQVTQLLGKLLQDLRVSVGVRPVQCTDLAVLDCTFQYVAPTQSVFAAGIFATGSTFGLQVHGCRFVRAGEDLPVAALPYHALAGCLIASAVEMAPGSAGTHASAAAPVPAVVPAQLERASIRDCMFEGLGAGVLALAALGSIRIEDNTVLRSNAGFLLISPEWLDFVGFQAEIKVPAEPAAAATAATALQDLLLAILLDPMVQIAGTIARLFPLPSGSTAKAVPFDQSRVNTEFKARVDGVQGLFDRSLAAQGSSGKPKALTDRTAFVASRFGSNGDLAGFTKAVASLAAIERGIVGVEPDLLLSLATTGNDIRAVVKTDGGSAAFAVLERLGSESQATITGERWRNSSAKVATAVVAALRFCAVSGNVVVNETQRGTSLAVLPPQGTGESAAIAGNTFFGAPMLPARSLQTPLDTWNIFNAGV